MKNNIILITADDMRADRLGALSNMQLTPFLDQLAEKGMLFRNAISNASSTWPSFSSIITSSDPLLHGGYYQLAPTRKTIAEHLKANGFFTSAYVTNSYLTETPGYKRGFDLFQKRKQFSFSLRITRKLLRKLKVHNPAYYGRFTASQTNDMFMNNLNSLKKPFFTWLYYLDPHFPWYPDKESLSATGKKLYSISEMQEINRIPARGSYSERIVDLYEASVYYLDKELEKLYEVLKKNGLLDHTIIIFTSDHGELLNSRGYTHGHPPMLYEELLRIPMMITGPDIPNISVDGLRANIDLAPTIADIAGVPSAEEFEGKSLLEDPLETSRTYFAGVSHYKAKTFDPEQRVLAYRTEKWKYIRSTPTGMDELYNIADDPHETNNLIGTALNVEDELKKIVETREQLIEAQMKDKEQKQFIVDDSVKKQLEDLGYID